MTGGLLTPEEIRSASEDLPAFVRRTPILPLDPDGSVLGKCESLQVTGSYKVRAAWTVLRGLDPEQRRRGAALSSSGNFAAAFAFAGRRLGVPTTLVMMERTDPEKVERTRRFGGEVVFCENRFEARFETLRRLEAERGLVAIDHMEHRDVLRGHATAAWEMMGQLPQDVAAVLAPVSTAGLLAGTAAAVKAVRPQVKVYGVQPEGSNATWLSFRRREVSSIPEVHTICDALTATRPGSLPFEHVTALVEDILLVSDDEVAEAVRWLAAEARLVVEPGGAVGVAALRSGRLNMKGPSCVMLSGGNVSVGRLAAFLAGGT